MALQSFSGIIALDSTGALAVNAPGVIYAKSDVGLTTPLSAQDANGLPLDLTTNSVGKIPDFQVDTIDPAVWWKSGDLPPILIMSIDSLIASVTGAQTSATASQAAAVAAQTASVAAQAAAEAGASSAATSLAAANAIAAASVKSVNGVFPDGSGNITIATGGGGGTGGAVTSVAGRTGDVSLTKTDVGLSQVDNTSDANKPVSAAQLAALNAKAALVHTHVIGDVTSLQSALDSKRGVSDPIDAALIATGVIAPARLGTGSSITTKFLRGDGTWQTPAGGGGGGAVDSVNGQTGDVVLGYADVGALADTYTAPVTSVFGRTGAVIGAKGDVGLGNVDNTSDANKPTSTAQAASIATAIATAVLLTGAQTVGGVKTFTSSPVVPDASFPEAKVTGLVADLAAKATDTAVVHNTGTETVAGAKTFSTAPTLPAGTAVAGSGGITKIVQLTAAAYAALGSKDSATMYVLVG